MKSMRLAVAMGAVLAISAGSADAGIINGGFESALTVGWTVVPGSDATASAADPDSGTQNANLGTGGTATDALIESSLGLPSGSLDAAITAAVSSGNQDAIIGSAIWQDVVLGAGETIKFRWRFLDGEIDPGFEDFVFVSLSGPAVVGPQVLTFANAGNNSTGYADGSITALVAGTYRLGFGALDELFGDPVLGHSTGRVDGVEIAGQVVPVPGTLALFGFGLFGLTAVRRRMIA